MLASIDSVPIVEPPSQVPFLSPAKNLLGIANIKRSPKERRTAFPLPPPPPFLDPNKSRFSASSNDFSEFLKDLDVSDREEPIARALSAPPLASTLKSTEEAYNSFKIAFADEAFRSFTARSLSTTSNGSSASPPESSTLVVTVNKAASNEEVNAQVIDRLLDATDKGPVPQTVRQNDEVYISFSDWTLAAVIGSTRYYVS